MTKRISAATADSGSAVPSFTPVPVRPRRDGWTPAKQVAFIKALAAGGCVADACRNVGMSTQSAYDLYNRPDAGSLRQAWRAALDQATNRLLDALLSRALNGVATPIFFQGEQIGERRRYDERLPMWLLRHFAPERFGAWRDSHVFRRDDPDGVAKILEYALRCLARDLLADAAGKPRAAREEATLSNYVGTGEDAEQQAESRSKLDAIRRRIQEEVFQQRLARIACGELRPGETDGNVAPGSST